MALWIWVATLQYSIAGLDGIPGYLSPADAPPAGLASQIYIGVLNNNGTYEVNIPLDYMPSGCDCDVNNFSSSGTSCFLIYPKVIEFSQG